MKQSDASRREKFFTEAFDHQTKNQHTSGKARCFHQKSKGIPTLHVIEIFRHVLFHFIQKLISFFRRIKGVRSGKDFFQAEGIILVREINAVSLTISDQQFNEFIRSIKGAVK